MSKQTRHLSYDNPLMVQVREWVEMAVTSSQVHSKLIAHFDQVWSTHYEPARRVLWKDASQRNKLPDPDRKFPSKKRLMEGLNRALNIPTSQEVSNVHDGPKPASLCAQSTLVPIDYNRQARTTTTLSWSDGSMGRAYITASPSVVFDPQYLSKLRMLMQLEYTVPHL